MVYIVWFRKNEKKTCPLACMLQAFQLGRGIEVEKRLKLISRMHNITAIFENQLFSQVAHFSLGLALGSAFSITLLFFLAGFKH